MSTIHEHRRVQRRLRSLHIDILKRYQKWKDIVTISGPAELGLVKGFDDESLRGEWNGHRSFELGKQFRVIYRVEKNQVFIQVMSVTAHDYRKK